MEAGRKLIRRAKSNAESSSISWSPGQRFRRWGIPIRVASKNDLSLSHPPSWLEPPLLRVEGRKEGRKGILRKCVRREKGVPQKVAESPQRIPLFPSSPNTLFPRGMKGKRERGGRQERDAHNGGDKLPIAHSCTCSRERTTRILFRDLSPS